MMKIHTTSKNLQVIMDFQFQGPEVGRADELPARPQRPQGDHQLLEGAKLDQAGGEGVGRPGLRHRRIPLCAHHRRIIPGRIPAGTYST